MGPRLREPAPRPAARGRHEAGFTQPRAHLLVDPCINVSMTRKREYIIPPARFVSDIHKNFLSITRRPRFKIRNLSQIQFHWKMSTSLMQRHYSATSSSLSSAMTMAALTSIALKRYPSAPGRSLDNLFMSTMGA